MHVADQKRTELVRSARGVLLSEPDTDGIAELIVSKVVAEVSLLTRRPVTLLAAKSEHEAWRVCLEDAGVPRVRYLTPLRVANLSASLDEDRETLIIDQRCLSHDLHSVSWQLFAPAIRRAPYVYMLATFDKWPRALKHVELVGHMDTAVTLHASELLDASA